MVISAPAGFTRAKEKIDMLAMLCSKPEVTKAKMHQNIIMSFPDSDFIFMLHHVARQTKVLHKTALQNISMVEREIFESVELAMKDAVDPLNKPVFANMKASIIEPIKLPSQQKIQRAKEFVTVMFLVYIPTDMVKLFPVKSSPPDIMTRLRATPKASPMKIFTPGTWLSVNMAPKEKSNKTPKPMNMPASRVSVKYLAG